MKRAHQLGNSQVAVEDVEIPRPGRGQVLVKTAVSAICGSEMHDYRKGGMPVGNFGHEAAGIVSAVGDGVTSPAVGTRVGVSAVSGCGECAYCRKGQYTWCDRFEVFGNMHADYFVIPARACHVIPDDISWDVGVLISGDGLGVPYHTSQKINACVETVAVYGLGPIGLGNVLVQSYLGRQVIGIDLSPYRLALTEKLGAKSTIKVDQDTDAPAMVKSLTGGRGADVAIEAAGIPATAKSCFASVRKGGTVIFNGEQKELSLSPSEDFIRRDITAVGSWFYHFNEFPAMLAMARGGLRVADLITHHYPIAEADAAFKTMAKGESGKILLTYG